jgi:hypothetical protein
MAYEQGEHGGLLVRWRLPSVHRCCGAYPFHSRGRAHDWWHVEGLQGQLRALTATGVMGRTRYITGVSGGASLIRLGRAALRRTLSA